MLPIKHFAKQSDIERDLRYDTEQEHSYRIFYDTARAMESLNDEECEYRKREASDAVEYLVESVEILVLFRHKIHCVGQQIVMDKPVPYVIHKHEDACHELKNVARYV